MEMRNPGLRAALAATICVLWGGIAHGQYQLQSLESLTADADVVVRGVVVDVVDDVSKEKNRLNMIAPEPYFASCRKLGAEINSSHKSSPIFTTEPPYSTAPEPTLTTCIVTLKVLDTFKGEEARQRTFTLRRGLSWWLLEQWKTSKKEMVWILKRAPATAVIFPEQDGRAREIQLLTQHTTDCLHAPRVSGLMLMPVIVLDPDVAPLVGRVSVLSRDLKFVAQPDAFVKALREALSATKQDKVRWHWLQLPGRCFVVPIDSAVPEDRWVDEFARRLVQNPADFLSPEGGDTRALLLEGVKLLRLSKSEKSLALLRSWLDEPMAVKSLAAKDGAEPTFTPQAPAAQDKEPRHAIPRNLADVPEVHFQQPLTKDMSTAVAQLKTAVTIDLVHAANRKKTDGFIEALARKRSDLAGLSFTMGDACRMKPEASQQFVRSLKIIRKFQEWYERLKRDGEVDNDADPSILLETQNARLEILTFYWKLRDQLDPSIRVASLMQVLGPEDVEARLGLIESLDEMAHADAARALAKLAIFSEEPAIRTAAVRALKLRRDSDYTDVLLAGLQYPWPAVAQRSSEAIVQLGRTDLVPHLQELLESPDPRAPQTRESDGKKVTVVRELVRINHHHNCLLCHAPATSNRDGASKDETEKLDPLTAQVPVPSESMTAYYRPSNPDILVRFDVTYLRQDFSLKLPVKDAAPWPDMQRYDFVVRTREVTEQEADVYRDLLQPSPADSLSPYRRAAQAALRALTGRATVALATAGTEEP